MIAAHMAKHMRDGKNDAAEERIIPSTLLEDMAGWAQAAFMAVPAFVYALIYYSRWQKYTWLRVSSTLITVRLEDALLPIVLTVFFGWSQLINWMPILLDAESWRIKASKILHPFLCVVIAVQCVMILTEAIRLDVYDYSVIVRAVLQLGLSLYINWLLNKAKPKSYHQGVRFVSVLVVFVLLLTANVVHFSYHFGKYQYVSDDNAIIVGFDSQGRAIEKGIVDISDERVCTLESDYRLKDVSGKTISIVQFGHLAVDTTRESDIVPKQRAIVKVVGLQMTSSANECAISYREVQNDYCA